MAAILNTDDMESWRNALSLSGESENTIFMSVLLLRVAYWYHGDNFLEYLYEYLENNNTLSKEFIDSIESILDFNNGSKNKENIVRIINDNNDYKEFRFKL